MTKKIRFRVSVVALFVDKQDVLLMHQATPPEPDCWDLPGGGLAPLETLISGLKREVKEEIGLTEFQVERLLTVAEAFYKEEEDRMLHKLDIVYQCRASPRPTAFQPEDLQEIGPKGIRWIALAELNRSICSSRAWKALQAAQLVS